MLKREIAKFTRGIIRIVFNSKILLFHNEFSGKMLR